jgi:predicted dehydrogenase
MFFALLYLVFGGEKMKETIKIGLSGFGYIGKIHTIALKSMPLCYENFPYTIRLFKLNTNKALNNEQTGFENICKDFNGLFDSDIIDICTPNYIHKQMIESAIKGKVKNIYCEKPLTGNYQDELELSKLIEQKDTINGIALVLRFLPCVIRAKSLVENGAIGEIIGFNCHMYHQSYLDPNRKMSWRLEKDKSGGGALMDLGIHLADLVTYLLGPVRKVRGRVETIIKERPTGEGNQLVDVDDYAQLNITMAEGFTGTLEVSRVAAGKGEDTWFEIFGTKGSIKIDIGKSDYPIIYKFDTGLYIQGNYMLDNELENEMRRIYPNNKFSLGWMANIHMASIYCFILKTKGIQMEKIKNPDFSDAMRAEQIIDGGYRSAASGKEVIL